MSLSFVLMLWKCGCQECTGPFVSIRLSLTSRETNKEIPKRKASGAPWVTEMQNRSLAGLQKELRISPITSSQSLVLKKGH